MKSSLKANRIRYKLIEEHLRATSVSEYAYAKRILFLLRNRSISIGLNDDAGTRLEMYAETLECRISYNRTYSRAHISF